MDESNKPVDMEIDDSNYNRVKEGQAECLFHKTSNQVFYNPIQEFNRDLSIACLNTYSKINNNKKLRILEALAASGIRSMRYAKEIENCTDIVANDFDKKAVELIDLNTKLNGVENIVKSNFDDATVLMNRMYSEKKLFDSIDLDPYGSPSMFLDSAVRSIKSGGMLLVTATDAGVLCGNGADTCYTKYGAMSIRTPSCHEMALRILLQSINSHAIRYSKYIVPVLSLSIDFYFRVFVLVFDGQMKAKQSLSNIGFVYICHGCNSFFQQDFGKTVPTNGNCKFVPGTDFISSTCTNCATKLKVAGPVWTGPLHDTKFVSQVIEHIELSEEKYGTQKRILGMLNLVVEEIESPLYYVLDQLCAVMHCEPPNHVVFRSALLNAGYKVSYSHANQNSIKTNAPTDVVWAILKAWVIEKPINKKWLKPEFKVTDILKNESTLKVDFTVRQDATPMSKKNKLVRFHDPPPFWGPKAKPKRKSEDIDNKQSVKKVIVDLKKTDTESD